MSPPKDYSEALARFVTDLKPKIITSGQFEEWTLPTIEANGKGWLKEVRIEPDPLIEDQITFDSLKNMIYFLGEKIEALTSKKIVQIKITLINEAGENPYSQTVIVMPSQV